MVFDRPDQDVTHLEEVYWPESDESLASRAAGDASAMTELYLRYKPRVSSYCRHKIADRSLAEDVESQIYLRMIEGLNKGTVERVRPWVFSIAHNEIVTAYRRRRPTAPIESAATVASPERSPEDVAIARGDVRELHRLIPQLTRNEREVLELRLFGLTNTEMCEVLGRSYAWVATNQTRALKHLRSLMLASGPQSEA